MARITIAIVTPVRLGVVVLATTSGHKVSPTESSDGACCASGQHFFDDPRLFNTGEAKVEPLEPIGEPFVIDSKLLQHGGM